MTRFFTSASSRVIYWLVLVTLLPSCGRTAWFGARNGTKHPHSTAIFLDRDGSLYPTLGPPVDGKGLENSTGYLLAYYLDDEGQRTKLMTDNGIDASMDIDKSWPSLQHKLRMDASQDITKKLNALGPNATLVVLIHGFNNTSDESIDSYKAAEDKIESSGMLTGSHLFLEVYWDGRFGKSLPLFFVYSQANAKFVGLGLREILSGVAPSHPVRILTHSLGAVVATNALWNVTTTMQKDPARPRDTWFWQQLNQGEGYSYRAACLDTVHYRTPAHPNLRLAMIAAATPGETFTDYSQRTPGLRGQKGVYKRVTLGANQYDEVITRLNTGLPILGYTNLGWDPAIYTSYVDETVNKAGHDGTAKRFQLYGATNPDRKKHSWILYMRKSDMMPQFLEDFLGK